MENYITLSLETHLFFARIMKEHSLFLEAGFPCQNESWIKKADYFRTQFEELLFDTVKIANGQVGNCILQSNELVTEFTFKAEKRTESLGGVPINTNITKMEQELRPGRGMNQSRELLYAVQQINRRAFQLLNGLIEFKENILAEVIACKLFTFNYPLLIKHIIREAKLYRSTVENLLQNRRANFQSLFQIEEFWNRIMMEHALFIRGLLDPSEEELIDTADDFAEDYKRLLEMAKEQDGRATAALTQKSLAETIKYRGFKAAGTQGILCGDILSIIMPLLADHVLREANHYIRLLTCNQRNLDEF